MDIDELIELVQLHGKSIYGFCYKLTGTKEETDDLYQETFLKAVELRHKMDGERNPKAFLIAIAVHIDGERGVHFAEQKKPRLILPS